jgi:phosphoribosylformylglycinamidine cyclo-ligase
MAHITGGGITENLDRVLPETCDAKIARGSWRVPRIFRTVGEAAALADDELYRTFNMGIGYTLVVDRRLAADAAAVLHERGERVFEIGEIVEGTGKVTYGG